MKPPKVKTRRGYLSRLYEVTAAPEYTSGGSSTPTAIREPLRGAAPENRTLQTNKQTPETSCTGQQHVKVRQDRRRRLLRTTAACKNPVFPSMTRETTSHAESSFNSSSTADPVCTAGAVARAQLQTRREARHMSRRGRRDPAERDTNSAPEHARRAYCDTPFPFWFSLLGQVSLCNALVCMKPH